MDNLERYRAWLSVDEIAQLIEALQHPLPMALRVNTLKIDMETAGNRWPAQYDWTIESVPFCPEGWQIVEYDLPLGQTLEYKMGYYYIQDAASMLPATLFSDTDSPLVLDMCAAPGGKTTHLVSRFHDTGLVVANDSSPKRIAALRSNLQMWGAMGVLVTNYLGEHFGRWFPETFDKVLLDAPCSGDTLREEKGRKKRVISDVERGTLVERQIALLTSAFHALQTGGEIVYSTCTLAPEENEGVLDALLKTYPHHAQIESINQLPATGLVLEGYHPSVQNGVRLWPYMFQTSGFFAARIRKTDSLDLQMESLPIKHTVDLSPVRKTEQSSVIGQLQDAYGFYLELDGLGLYERNGNIFAVPDRVFRYFEEFPIISAGLMVGQFVEGEFIPSHELITRFENYFTERRMMIAEQVDIWLDGRDLRGMEVPYPNGTIILLEDEDHRFLGRGKVLQGRVRNMLPKRAI